MGGGGESGVREVADTKWRHLIGQERPCVSLRGLNKRAKKPSLEGGHKSLFLVRGKVARDGVSRPSCELWREETVFKVPELVVDNAESLDSNAAVVMVGNAV